MANPILTKRVQDYFRRQLTLYEDMLAAHDAFQRDLDAGDLDHLAERQESQSKQAAMLDASFAPCCANGRQPQTSIRANGPKSGTWPNVPRRWQVASSSVTSRSSASFSAAPRRFRTTRTLCTEDWDSSRRTGLGFRMLPGS